MFFEMSAGPMMSLTFCTALRTPLPRKRLGSLSRSSKASYIPVEAPDGTAARKTPLGVVSSTSTVGLPRLQEKCWSKKINTRTCLLNLLASQLDYDKLLAILSTSLNQSGKGLKMCSYLMQSQASSLLEPLCRYINSARWKNSAS